MTWQPVTCEAAAEFSRAFSFSDGLRTASTPCPRSTTCPNAIAEIRRFQRVKPVYDFSAVSSTLTTKGQHIQTQSSEWVLAGANVY
jgi:hypothetical protein